MTEIQANLMLAYLDRIAADLYELRVAKYPTKEERESGDPLAHFYNSVVASMDSVKHLADRIAKEKLR